MALELDLLLMTGRAADVREWTNAEQAAALGEASYHWLRAKALAAEGDYAGAEQECAQTGRGDRQPGRAGPREQMALTVGQLVLHERAGEGTVLDLIRRAATRAVFLDAAEEHVAALGREAGGMLEG